jgi:hypothetical protein
MTTPTLPEPEGWRITDGEGGYNYSDESPAEFNRAWAGRYGRVHEPLFTADQMRAYALAAIAAHPQPAPLTPRELELIDGMIQVQLHHAAQCDGMLARESANHRMAKKQKGWDMERVALLRKLAGIVPAPTTDQSHPQR